MLKLNKDKNYVQKILAGIESSGGYCPCQIFRDEYSLCRFSYYYLPSEVELSEICINGQDENRCMCGLYK